MRSLAVAWFLAIALAQAIPGGAHRSSRAPGVAPRIWQGYGFPAAFIGIARKPTEVMSFNPVALGLNLTLAVVPALGLWFIPRLLTGASSDRLCPACGYDLRGALSGGGRECPECGAGCAPRVESNHV